MIIKTEKIRSILKQTLKVIFIISILILVHQTVYASGLENTKLVTGTESLVKAIINWLVGIGITISGGYFIYYVFCLKTNDEGERRRNIQNIKTTLIVMVLITTGLALLDAILSFYK